jgi:hypothetical protein
MGSFSDRLSASAARRRIRKGRRPRCNVNKAPQITQTSADLRRFVPGCIGMVTENAMLAFRSHDYEILY